MANQQLPLGIRFSERDVDTKGIITGVQKAINKAIAQVDFTALKKRLAGIQLKASTLLPKRVTDSITTRLNQAINRFILKFDERKIKTAPLISKVRRAIDTGIRQANLSPLIDKFVKNQSVITRILKRSIDSLSNSPIFVQMRINSAQLKAELRKLSARRDLVITVRAKIIPDKASLADIKKQLGIAATAPAAGTVKQTQTMQSMVQTAKQYGLTVQQANTIVGASADASAKKISVMAGGLGRAARRVKELRQNATDLTRKQEELKTLFKDAGVGATEFGAKLAQIGKRFTAFFAYTIGVFKMIEATRLLIDEVKRLDQTVLDLAKVLPQVNTEDLTNRLVDLAARTGRTFEEASEAAIGFARAGLKEVDDIAKATEASLRLLNISTIDTATSFKLMITIANAFGIGFEEAATKVAVFSEFADNAAVTVEDLANGFIRGGAAADAAGLSVEEFGAIVATVTGTTQISATRIGTAFKTMLSRILRNREAILDTVRVTQGLDKTTLELSRELDTTQKVILAMGEAWRTMNASQKANFAQIAVGGRRLTELAAILDNTGKFTEQLGRVTDAAASAQRKEAIEAQGVAAANRQVLRAVTEVAKIIRDTGIVELYKDAATVLGQTIGLAGKIVSQTRAWGNTLKDIKGVEVGEPLAVFSAGLGEVIDGVGLLRRTFLVLFAQILLPSIQKAITGFTTFIRGSDIGINKLIAEQGNLNAQAFKLVDAQGQAITNQNKLTKAVKQTTAAYQQAQGALPTARAAITGAGAAAGTAGRGASNFAATLQQAVLNPLTTVRKGIQGVKTGIVKAGKGIQQGFAFLSQPVQGFAGTMVKTTATMTALDAASAAAAKAAEGFAARGQEAIATALKLGSTAGSAAASLIPFGKRAALAGAALATLPQSISTIIGAINTVVEANKQFAEVASEQVRVLKAIRIAERPGAEVFREQLIARGIAEEYVVDGELRLRVPKGVDTNDVINIAQLRRQALSPLQRELFDIQKEMVKVGDALAEGIEDAVRKSNIVEKYRSIATEIEQEKISLQFEFESKNFIALSEEFDNLILKAQAFERSPVRINIPELDTVQGLAQELFNAKQAISAIGEDRTAAQVIKLIADDTSIVSDQINTVRTSFQEAENDVAKVGQRLKEAKDAIVAAEKDSKDFTQVLKQSLQTTEALAKAENVRTKGAKAIAQAVSKIDLAEQAKIELLKSEEQIREKLLEQRSAETAELVKQIAISKQRATVSAKQLLLTNEQLNDFIAINRLQAENAVLAAGLNDPFVKTLSTLKEITAENTLQQRQLERLEAIQKARIEQVKEQLRFVEGADVDQIVAGIEAEFKIKEAEINKTIIENIFQGIRAQIELEGAAEQERIDTIIKGISQVEDAELARLDVLKGLSEVVVQEDFGRFVQGLQSLQNVEVGAFVQKSAKMRKALKNLEQGLEATSKSIFDGGVITQQLEGLGTDITNVFGRQRQIQLAFALQRIDIERDAEAERLNIEKERATSSIQLAKIERDLRINEQKRQKDQSVALAKEAADGAQEAFGRITESMNNIISISADIKKVDDEIKKLRVTMEFQAPEQLTREAAGLEDLKQQRAATAAQLEQAQAFEEQIRKGYEMADALSAASVQGAKFVQSIKFQLGVYDSVSSALGSLTAAYNSFTGNLATSEKHLFELRAQLARDAVTVLKSQFDSLRGFGQRLFTASFGQLNELSRAAEFLGRDAAEVPLALRDAFAELLKITKGGPAAELEIAIAGLERAGLDTTELERLQSQTIRHAEEAARNDMLALEAQQKSADNSATATAVLQRQLNLMDKDIKAAEEAKTRIEELKEEYVKSHTEITKTDQQKLQEARERKKYLQSQLSLHGKEYQLNTQRYSQLIALTRETAGATTAQGVNFSQMSESNAAIQASVEQFAQVAEEAKTQRETLNQQITSMQEAFQEATAAITEQFTAEQMEGAMTTALKAESTRGTISEAIKSEEVLNIAAFDAGIQTLNENSKILQKAITDGDAAMQEAVNTTTSAVRDSSSAITGQMNEMQTAIVRAVNNIQIRVQKVVQAPTAAGGLSVPEMHGIISAARHEKAKMPANASLVLANSSELIMTQSQARKIFGQIQAPDSVRDIARTPMVQMRTTSTEKKVEKQQPDNVNKLVRKLEELIDKAENQHLFKPTQEVQIKVDGKRDINIKGIENLNQKMKDAFRKEMGHVASKAEVNLITTRIDEIVRRLKMMGLDGVK